MLLTTTVEVKIRKNTLQYYLDKGYDCKVGDVVVINTLDLPPHSGIMVTYKCDYPGCNEQITLKFEDYYKKRQREYANKGDFCNKHNKAIRAQWMQENHPEEYKRSYELRQIKTKATCQEKYNCDNPMQNEEVKPNLKNTMQNKYGVDNAMQVPKFREALMETLYTTVPTEITSDNGKVSYIMHGIPCSKNQKHLGELFNGKINEMVKYYWIDILLDNKIYFEYNGTGHKLSVQMGRETEEDFLKREYKRYCILKQNGYKQIVFVSIEHNTLPPDSVLIGIKEVATQYLQNHNWIEFNYDEKNIRTKDKVIPYDFLHELTLEEII